MKKLSGVSKNLYSKYDFEDHLWSATAPQRSELLELAERCVKVDGIYYLKQPRSGHWVPFKTMSDAMKEAYNKWLGGRLKCGTEVTDDLINTFFNGVETSKTVIGNKIVTEEIKVGSCPNIQHAMVVPLGPQYVIYNKDTYLNTWNDEMLSADASKARMGKLVLEMIYRSLCNGDELHADKNEESNMLIEQILTNTYTHDDFRFCINWLAAIYQRPGINLQTNLWFCGEQQGVGKGTLVTIMKGILGSNFVGTLNQTEIEAGWNDHLVGKMLVESNEFDTSGKMNGKAWNKWIKAHCNEEVLPIRQRNTTSRAVLNISNYIFTSNDESPMWIDKSDRRNHMIKTTDDVYWKEFASIVQTKYVIPNLNAIASGFAWILEQVQVDMEFIKSAFVNNLKAQILADSANIVERWITTDPLIKHNCERTSIDWYADFKQWMAENSPSERIIADHVWGKMMSKCSSLGVLKRRTNGKMLITIGHAVAAPAANREAIAAEVGSITDEFITVENHDIPALVREEMVLTPMEKIRAAIRREEAQNERFQ